LGTLDMTAKGKWSPAKNGSRQKVSIRKWGMTRRN